MATEAAGRAAYVLHTDSTAMTVLDTAQRSVTGSAPAGPAATRMALAPDGTRAYVTGSSSDTVTVVDLTTSTELDRYATGDKPGPVAVSVDGARLFVLLDSGVLQVLDAATGAEVGRVAVGNNAAGGSGLVVHPGGNRLYVATGPLVEVDTATLSVTRQIPVTAGTGAHGVVLSPDGGTAYVASSELYEGGIDVVDLAAGSVTARVNLGSIPGPLAIAPGGGQLYVAIAATFVNPGTAPASCPAAASRWSTPPPPNKPRPSTSARAGRPGTCRTPPGLAVSADGSTVLASVPRLSAVLVSGRTSATVEKTVATAARPGQVVVPSAAPAPPAPVADAVLDRGRLPAAAAGTAVPDVLVNDTVDGAAASLATTRLRQLSSTSPDLALDPTDGSVDLLRATTAGTAAVSYRLCTRAPVRVCDRARAVVRLTG